MKKIFLISLIALLNTFVLGANLTSMDCNDVRLTGYTSGTLSTGTSYQCSTCFKGSDLYYRSGHTIENINNLYDGFDVPGVSPRIMWTDETWVDWDVLNNKFTIGSDLSTTRSDPKGFKFEDISVSDPQRQPFWQTANNAPNTGRIFGIFYTADPLLTYVRSTGGISLDGVSNTATPSDRNKPMWRIAYNAASRTTNIATGVDGAPEDHIQCAFTFPSWCGDGVIDNGSNGTQNKGEQCDDGNMTSGDGCSSTCQTETTSACTSLSVSPASAKLTGGGTVTLTCAGSGTITSYSIVVKKPDGTTLTTLTNASGTATIPATPTGQYTAQCFINGQTTTPAACQKSITAEASKVPSIGIDKRAANKDDLDTDVGDDTQTIERGSKAVFKISVANNGNEVLEKVVIADDLSRECEKDESETRDLIRTIGNRDSLFDPGEIFTYTCQKKSVQMKTFPDEINTICTEANGVETDEIVDDCDETSIITNEIEEPEESLICLSIESSQGSFGGAPFRTDISCEAVDYDSCEIEVTLDGEVIDTYNDCSKNITFSKTGNYSVACVVNDERTPDCEMEIEVAAMTDIPTGAKILILAFLSMLLAAIGTHLYQKKTS